jgi:tetratricopeptide (TPR) repeat protein
MSKMETKMVEEYQKIMARDPGSRVFAALADAYRDMGLLEQAEEIARRGVGLHHNYAPGYVALARILLKKNQIEDAIEFLRQATHLSADNVLAWQVLGESLLLARKVKEALRAHKMALFLNPSSKRSESVVKKLEALSAEEFSEDIFEMQPLSESSLKVAPNPQAATPVASVAPLSLERELSVVDALIVRQKTEQAKERLNALFAQHPGHPEIQNRWTLVAGPETLEEPADIKPLARRETLVIQKKIRILKALLKSVSQHSLS